MPIFSAMLKPLAYLSVPYILLKSLSAASPRCQYYIRLYVYLATMATMGACSSFIAIAMAIAGKKYDTHWAVARFFYIVAGRMMEIEVSVEGEEWLNTRPAVLVSNHQSVLDILVMGRWVQRLHIQPRDLS